MKWQNEYIEGQENCAVVFTRKSKSNHRDTYKTIQRWILTPDILEVISKK